MSVLKYGKIENVEIISEKGRDLNIVNPWGESKVVMKSSRGRKITAEGNILRFKTSPGERYILSRE